MKERPKGFLSDISRSSEVFDYIVELHEYLWRVVRALEPGASGHLNEQVDHAIGLLEAAARKRPIPPQDRPE